MCLTINQDYKSLKEAKYYSKNPLIAKEEIKVYKILERCRRDNLAGKSPFQYMIYEKGFQYTENKFKFEYKFKVEYTSYAHVRDTYYITIEQGLHAFIDIKSAKDYKDIIPTDNNKLLIIEMYIPKGSKYFLGSKGDIVTDNLIWY